MAELIYVADDEKHIRELMRTFLENEGYQVKTFSDGYSVSDAMGRQMPDLLILDIMMPGEDGLSLCASIRKKSSVPIIIVSAKDSPMDRVTGIMMGSDDYLTKPFLPLELTARVKALFRRARMAKGETEPEAEAYQCGNMILKPLERKVYVNGETFPITPTEYSFLKCLIQQKEAAVSKTGLLEQVWSCQGIPSEARMPDDLVKRLRKKLKQRESTALIETVWGYGYRLTQKQGS